MSIETDNTPIINECARGRVTMRLDARLPQGSIIICTGTGDEHSFLVHRLGLSVECPTCGQIGLSVDLVADCYKRQMEASSDRTTVGTEAPSARLEVVPADNQDRDRGQRGPVNRPRQTVVRTHPGRRSGSLG